MRHIIYLFIGLIPFAALCFRCAPPTTRAELRWSADPAVILPRPMGALDLNAIGIADSAIQLQGKLLGSVRKTILNLYGDPFPPGSRYTVRVTLEPYKFRADLPFGVGFEPGGITLLDSLIKGPLPILEGDRATFTVRFNRQLSSGLYKMSFLIDSTGRYIDDVHKADNLYEDFLFVSGRQPFNVQWLTPDTMTIRAANPPPVAFSLRVSSATPDGPGVIYADMEVKAPQGSTATSAPVRGMRFPELPAEVDIAVQPSSAPAGSVEEMTILLRFYAADGGAFQEKRARVRILHGR